MTVSLSSPVTGAAQTGLTTPTYTVVADVPPDVNSKQWAVTALGGTQTNVEIHSVSKPFTFAAFRPKVLRQRPSANPVTGVVTNVPKNVYKFNTRKGASVAANQIPDLILIQTTISVPAGVDVYEPEDLRAALSLHFGAIAQQSAGIGDTSVTGLL